MLILTSLVLGFLFLISFLLGKAVAHKNRTSIFLVSSLFLFHFFIAHSLNRLPELEYSYLNNIFYGYIKLWWGYITFFYFGGLVSSITRKKFYIKLFHLLMFCILFQFLYSRYDVLSNHFIADVKPSSEGYCYQSYHYTCGAAAACTFLAKLNVDTTEKEMARRCRTGLFSGTNSFLLKECLNDKIKLSNTPGQFILKPIAIDEINQVKTPFLAAIELNKLTDHWIVVLGYNNEQINVFDPLRGEIDYRREDLKSIWRRRCIVYQLGRIALSVQ